MPPPEPLARPAQPRGSMLAAAWRTEVGRLRSRERRRRFPLEVCVGSPAGPRVSTPEPWGQADAHDAGLRFDVVDALVDAWRAGGAADSVAAAAWVSRPGAPELHDRDLAWYAACRQAFGAHRLRMVVFRAVTRTGWLDVATGERRAWKRLRL